MLKGDRVIILKDKCTPKYIKTDGIVQKIFGSFAKVEMYDGTEKVYLKDHLITTKEYYYTEDSLSLDTYGEGYGLYKADPPPIPKESVCRHENKYVNHPIGNFKFLYCPNCSMSWDVLELKEE